MTTQRLGCLSPLALLSAFLTLVILAVAEVISGNSMFSPGLLNAQVGASQGGVASHAEIGADCSRCHAPFWSTQSMSDLCLSCHTHIQEEIADPTSLHGVLTKDASTNCFTCHTEHHGPEAGLTVFDSAAFPHTVTGFSLDGHGTRSDDSPFACSDCHTQGISSFDQQICTDCHALLDYEFTVAHTLDFGQDCLACHDGVDRYGDFDHSQTAFPLMGAHQQSSCSGCHLEARTIPDLQNTPGTCVDCHLAEDAHAGRFGIECGACHTTQAWKPAQFDHSLTDFQLIGKHTETACEDCHTAGYQGTPKDCYSCHRSDDKHNGAYGIACESCHNPSGWEDVTFDHSLSAFPLDGAHVDVECVACHIDNVFKGTPQECAACHAEPDYHFGMFPGQPCSACHTTTAWSPALYNGPHTFPMDHGEKNNTCTDCHQPNLTQWSCYTCHERGETDRKHLEEGIANFNDCLRCHPSGQKEENNGGDDD